MWKSKEFNEGTAAFRAGQFLRDNPHHPKSEQWTDWYNGWRNERQYLMDKGSQAAAEATNR